MVQVRRNSTGVRGNLRNFQSGGEEAVFEADHEKKSNSETLIMQAQFVGCDLLLVRESYGMKGWPQAEQFKRRLKEYQAKSGKTQAQVASELDTTVGTLRFWRSGERPPKRVNLQAAASLFGCSVLEFMDDPAASVPGSETDWGNTTETDRILARRLFLALMRAPDGYRGQLVDGFVRDVDLISAAHKDNSIPGRTIGERLRFAREAMGYTREYTAARLENLQPKNQSLRTYLADPLHLADIEDGLVAPEEDLVAHLRTILGLWHKDLGNFDPKLKPEKKTDNQPRPTLNLSIVCSHWRAHAPNLNAGFSLCGWAFSSRCKQK